MGGRGLGKGIVCVLGGGKEHGVDVWEEGTCGEGERCIGEERVLCEWKGGEGIANICVWRVSVCRGEEGVVCVEGRG